MIQLAGFSPDVDPSTPGIMVDCENILPEITGFSSAPSKVDEGLGALDGQAYGFAVTRKSDNSIRAFAGSASKLYEVSTTWTDKSKSGGYSLGSDNRWRFAQFGDVSLAAAKSETLQASTTGNFDDASVTAPKAAIVETINNQVFVFNYDGMGMGNVPDGWGCSALGSYTDFTPSVANQSVAGRFLSSPGPVTAGRKLGDIIVAYKDRSMYVGQYVGGSEIWDWRMLPGNIGAPCQEAVVTTGTAHFFPGPDDFYVFDGSRPIPLDSPVRSWFFSVLDTRYAYRISGTFDRQNQRVLWWFPSLSSGGVLDKCLVYNIKTRQWGRMDGHIEIAAEYLNSGITYESIGSLYSTYDDIPTTISYDSPFWTSSGSVIAAFGTDHVAYSYTGTPSSSSITTHHHGDNSVFSTVSRVKPRFLTAPASSTLLYSHSNTDPTSFVQNLSSMFANQWYDVLWSARWHKFELQFTGSMKITGYDVTLTQDGTQ